MDSVQSQANRYEEALQDAVDDGRIEVPIVEVDFSHLPVMDPGEAGQGLYEPIGRITSLQAPHRVADAILRDSELDGMAFRKTEAGKKVNLASLRNATPLLDICPTALLFGLWDSTGPKGGLGVKFQRAIVSEIIGVGMQRGVKTSSRIDPLGIQLKAGPIYETADGDYTLDQELAALDKKKARLKGKDGKPSEVNHGNIPPSLSKTDTDPLGGENDKVYLAGGVTIDYAEQTTVISLPAIRRLRFPPESNAKPDRDRDLTAQTAIVALGLCAAALSAERGLDLRSRCLLWPETAAPWQLLGRSGTAPTDIDLSADAAVELLNESVAAVRQAGLPWRAEPLQLRPSEKLVELVRRSQELAVQSDETE